MQRCPKCKTFSLDDFGDGEKKCYRDGCGFRVLADGRHSFLKRDTDKIRRIAKDVVSDDETAIREFAYS